MTQATRNPQPDGFSVGDSVAWQLLDGNTMVGTITDELVMQSLINPYRYVRRIDGGLSCRVATHKLRLATYEDNLAAQEFFKNIGKQPK